MEIGNRLDGEFLEPSSKKASQPMISANSDGQLRLIAFYLPQFHPIPENDDWWGKGFTEWRNVVKARPLFRGHYQPHLPADLGFYDLRVPETRQAQADLAYEYGIYGFCYYHYWFNGRRILERPFDEVLASGKPDFPFCLCWANENWTRVWDGGSKDILLAQKYDPEDDLRHIQALIPALRDPRYVRVNGKPLLLIYCVEDLPNPRRTSQIWREATKKAGIDDLYLASVESFKAALDPKGIGFDAVVEFAPDWRNMGTPLPQGPLNGLLGKFGRVAAKNAEHRVFAYKSLIDTMMAKKCLPYTTFRTVTPGWDNSPRRTEHAIIFDGSTPEKYEQWLAAVTEQTLRRNHGEKRIAFINAWNEWGEGNHLEPDQSWGRAYLEATKRALL